MRKILGTGTKAAGVSAAGKLPENQKYGLGMSTPRDMVTILEKLEHGEIVNADCLQRDSGSAETLPGRNGHTAAAGRHADRE